MSKYNTFENSSQLAASRHNLTNVVLDNIEKLASLQLKMTKDTVHNFSESIKNLASANGAQELFEQANEIAKHNIKANNSNYQDFISLLNDARLQIIAATLQHTKSFKQAGTANLFNFLSKFKDNFNTNQAMDSFVKAANTVYSDATNFANKSQDNIKSAFTSVNKSAQNTSSHAAKPTTQRKPAKKAKTTSQKKPTGTATTKAAKTVNETTKTGDDSANKVTEAAKNSV